MCITQSFKMLLLICICLALVHAEVILSSNKNPSERVTSFAVDGDRLIFTYIDLDKESGPNGIIKTFLIGSGNDPEKMYLPPKSQPIISPIAVEIDECYRLWILDNGVQNISGIQDKSLSPVLQAIRLKTNKTIAKFSFDHTLRSTNSFLTTLAIDTEETCQNTWVYIADFNNAKLLSYNMQINSSFVHNHHFFNPDPMSNIPIELIYNKRHKTESGIYGLTISGSYLYFHPFASKYEFRVDKTLLKQPRPLLYGDVSLIGNRGSEAGIVRFDKSNYIYFYANFRDIGCWIDFENFTKIAIGLRDGFVTDIQVIGPKLWILSNTDNKYTFETRVIEDLIANTSCKPQLPHHRILNQGFRSIDSRLSINALFFIELFLFLNVVCSL